jgi:hypothetical protein
MLYETVCRDLLQGVIESSRFATAHSFGWSTILNTGAVVKNVAAPGKIFLKILRDYRNSL